MAVFGSGERNVGQGWREERGEVVCVALRGRTNREAVQKLAVRVWKDKRFGHTYNTCP